MKIIKINHLIMQILEIFTQIKEEKMMVFKIFSHHLKIKILKDLTKFLLPYPLMKDNEEYLNKEMGIAYICLIFIKILVQLLILKNILELEVYLKQIIIIENNYMIVIIIIQTGMNLLIDKVIIIINLKKENKHRIYHNQKANQQEENNNFQMVIDIKVGLKIKQRKQIYITNMIKCYLIIICIINKNNNNYNRLQCLQQIKKHIINIKVMHINKVIKIVYHILEQLIYMKINNNITCQVPQPIKNQKICNLLILYCKINSKNVHLFGGVEISRFTAIQQLIQNLYIIIIITLINNQNFSYNKIKKIQKYKICYYQYNFVFQILIQLYIYNINYNQIPKKILLFILIFDYNITVYFIQIIINYWQIISLTVL